MTLFKKKHFKELANKKGMYCISIYIPTHKIGDNEKAKIRLKNHLSGIEDQLIELNVKPRTISTLLKPMVKLLDNNLFWHHLSEALIIFRNENHFAYTTLPIHVDDFALVSTRYYLMPLLSSFNGNKKFFILTLSLNNNSLYEATQDEITKIVVDDILPGSMLESVGGDIKQKSLQARSGHTRLGFGLFHGKGEGKDDKQIEIRKYLLDIDKGLSEILKGYQFPLIVACVDNVFSMFKEVCSYKNLYPEAIYGNYDSSPISIIHKKACEKLTPYFNSQWMKKRNFYSSNNNKKSSNINELVKIADAGNVETLFVKRHTHVWGKYKENTGAVTIHGKKEQLDNCLLDLTAQSTFLNGGKVFLEEPANIPEPESAANAILRY